MSNIALRWFPSGVFLSECWSRGRWWLAMHAVTDFIAELNTGYRFMREAAEYREAAGYSRAGS